MTAAKQKLIIVESPATARTISKFLGKGNQGRSLAGHARDLPKSQIGVDVDNDFALKPTSRYLRGRGAFLKPHPQRGTHRVGRFTSQLTRTAEAISWHLSHVLNMDSN